MLFLLSIFSCLYAFFLSTTSVRIYIFYTFKLLCNNLITKDKIMLVSSLLALAPLLFILILLIFFKMAADIAGLLGLTLTLLLAVLYFDTSIQILPNIVFAGIVGSLPVGLVIATSILQVTVMGESGALGRIIALVKSLTPQHKAVQVLLINVGMGTLLTGLGAASMALFPPILLALGYSVSAAILLPCLGYLAFCMYALLGIPAVILATFSNQGLMETGISLASFMPLLSTGIAFLCLHIVGGYRFMLKGFWPALLAGLSSGFAAIALAKVGLVTVTAIVAGMTIVATLLIYVKLIGGPIQDTSQLTEKDQQSMQKFSLARAASPWLVLLVLSFIMNSPALPFFKTVFTTWSMPVEIIPGSPERLRIFWQAYFWVLVSTVCCVPFLRIPRENIMPIFAKGAQRAWRPFAATAVFFAIAYVMNHSGKNIDWQLTGDNNMILALAHEATALFGSAYPAAAPFLGLVAGFIGGSASSSVAMLTKLQMAAAESMGASSLVLVTANGIGGGLAGAISPSKLLTAAASIDKPEAANTVLGYSFILTLIGTALCAALSQWWAY